VALGFLFPFLLMRFGPRHRLHHQPAAGAAAPSPAPVTGGDYVYATVYQEWKVRKSGKALPMKNGVHRFKVRDGRVVEWFAAEDTQLSVEAVS
jgi:hypothetical protein